MTLLAYAFVLWIAGGLVAACFGRWARPASRVGAASAVAGCLLVAGVSASALLGDSIGASLPMELPYAYLVVELDALSGFFLIPMMLVAALVAIYGVGSMQRYDGRRNVGFSWLCYNGILASLVVILLARNGILFLLAWEVMTLLSFFLVMFDGDRDEVRKAGWTYLVAAHIGTAFLLAMFSLLGRASDSMDFVAFAGAAGDPRLLGVAFVFALIGFGTKAGLMPMHVWLPEAYPAAPSHVAAMMSGVMSKAGLYGLIRIITLLGAPPGWWGGTLIVIGAISGIVGILFAIAQHDIKRIIAYSSVENAGIITLGLGLGLVGLSYGYAPLTLLGFTGALLHVVNHSCFKSLLFMTAGSVCDEAGTNEIDVMGGLLKRMPTTGLCFLVGTAAICALPPLNGFMSEFMMYAGAFIAVGQAGTPLPVVIAAVAVIVSLAFIGGLALACFTKLFGILFLGEPRTAVPARCREVGVSRVFPPMVLAVACVGIGMTGWALFGLLSPAVRAMISESCVNITSSQVAVADAGSTLRALLLVTAGACGIVWLSSVVWLIRYRLLRGRPVDEAGTWDCGYVAPGARMQYTSSSFSQPITDLFRLLLGTRRRFVRPEGLFPSTSSFESDTPDVYRERLFRPVFEVVAAWFARLHWLQHGRLNLYVLGIMVALLALLILKMR